MLHGVHLALAKGTENRVFCPIKTGGQDTELDKQAAFSQDIYQNLKLERQQDKKLIRKIPFPSKEIRLDLGTAN